MDLAQVDQASDQFVGQWRRLVSTTNWEKGRIINEWREALVASEAPAAEWSDEAWSRRVGHVTPQHVGRLRRVAERFASSRDDFPGLFWSHFQAALDWDDAEMWLEGAVQNDWSIAEMRDQRRQTLGDLAGELSENGPDTDEPWDDDAEPLDAGDVVTGRMDEVRDPEAAGADDENDEAGYDRSQFDDLAGNEPGASTDASAAHDVAAVRPFAELPPLPPDVNDAFEAYKLCILRHRLAGWQEISRDDMLASLDSLRQLTLAPAEA